METPMQIIFYTISLVLAIIALFIIILIGIISTKHLKSSNKIQPIFKNLFHVSWIITSIGFLFFISCVVGHMLGAELCVLALLALLGLICIYLSAYNILLILIYRLHFSFKDSTFAVSKTTKCILITLYSVTIFLFALVSIQDIIMVTRTGCVGNDVVSTAASLNLIPIPLYILTTIITIIIFANKLLKLITFQRNTVLDVNELPSLKTHQKKMIENTTRYISLLTMGIFSSCCVMAFIWIFSRYVWIFSLILSIDAVINIIGLYLQFPFSVNHYKKYCKCLHSCWRYILTKNAKSTFMNRHKIVKNEKKYEVVENTSI
eukprot:531860_1